MAQPMPEDFGGVPLTIPDGWVPRPGTPVPVVRCTYIFPDTHNRPGEQCKRWSLRGTTKCVKHGGQLPGVKQHAEAVVEAARLRLCGSLDEATDILEDLMRNSTSDAVRLKAVETVYNRAGLRDGFELDVTVEQRQDPAEVLRERIQTLRKRTIEGELVERAALEATTEAEPDGTVLPDAPLTPNAEDPDADQQ